MKIEIAYPPNIDKIRKVFNLHKGIVFAYGDILYNPDDGIVDKPLMVHEETHMRQQGDKPSEWWNRYLIDKYFRASQEIEAYQNQYEEARRIRNDRNALFKYAHRLAMDLSGPIYGNVLTYREALNAITSPKKYIFNTVL